MLVRQNLEGVFCGFSPLPTILEDKTTWRQWTSWQIIAALPKNLLNSILGRCRGQPGWTLWPLAPKPRGRWRWCCLKWWDVSIHRLQQVDAVSMKILKPSETRGIFWIDSIGQRNWSTVLKAKKDWPLGSHNLPSRNELFGSPWFLCTIKRNKNTIKYTKDFFSGRYSISIQINKYIVFQFVVVTSHFSNMFFCVTTRWQRTRSTSQIQPAVLQLLQHVLPLMPAQLWLPVLLVLHSLGHGLKPCEMGFNPQGKTAHPRTHNCD